MVSISQSISPPLSPILQMARRAAARRAEGHDVIDLTLGEPDFSAPEHVISAAHEALALPLTYSPANGLPRLRQAIRARLQQDRGLTYDDDQIAVGCGAKQIIFNAFLATLRPGDEVIIPAPYWASYPDMVRMFGGVPIILPTETRNGFRLEPSSLAAALSDRTRWLVLNAPGNPSGATYEPATLLAFAEILRQHPQVRVLSDDIYAHIRFGSEPYATLAAVAEDMRERTLLVDGVSKAYAMTGWRVGWGCGSAELVRAITSIQSQNCTQTSTLSQLAAIAALEGPQDGLAERAVIYRQRRDAALTELRRSPRIDVMTPDGAFYLLPKIHGVRDDNALALRLLDAGVATVPGSAFGVPGHLRVSFATDLAVLVEGCRRIVTVLEASE
ncbi:MULTISPECIES: pyridoxal phosphate-dependent aminotransferase [Pectobacterium]|uniref:Aminotransferase n=1 Tax=Pectobacterium odoriferum TaxID=78398 RepID=A0ABR4VKE7_9GAMM|nr:MULTISPECIES: pyridoxal phosphate-dependent aminotransferase [Pectobacterium]KGA39830.1 hypothetical protein KU75_20575 [Pectobacterium odoriferum]MBA0162917.1 pyridoxal phosphate-dependent aminotransferase [Pectobacterium versatile]MBN3058479.1 pyridoxal phosphate-dependent aminotransferase [Pectobacterium versatile]MBQ4780935.1 aminotransferase class I/II-fold pyridoxal phosphate-dependent enzyme [Pectobacterium versatile]MBQ4785492.1 aminotransferase class I/II-fold pyridoxal phosphate-d